MITDTSAGTPQGSPISPLLANIALHVLDGTWETSGQRLGVLVRYADDFVVLLLDARPGRRGPTASDARLSVARAAVASRQDHDRASRRRRAGLRLLGVPSPDARVQEVEGSLVSSTSGRRRGPWRRSGPRSVNAPIGDTPVMTSGRRGRWTSTPCCGAGATTSVGNSARKFADIDNYVGNGSPGLASIKHGRPGSTGSADTTSTGSANLGIYRTHRQRPYRTPTHASR